MYTKIQVSGKIEVLTGMHIGGSSQFSAIGSVDAPVIIDNISKLPIIPGSSIKGKLRTLLAKEFNGSSTLPSKPEDDDVRVRRLFGSPKDENNKKEFSRLLFSDLFLSNMDELTKSGLPSVTEIKFENTINRLTAKANPRQIERTVRGAIFDVYIIYNVVEPSEVIEDFENLAKGLKLLQLDYLGGHGSRGYGRVKFSGLEAKEVIGKLEANTLEKCNGFLEAVMP